MRFSYLQKLKNNLPLASSVLFGAASYPSQDTSLGIHFLTKDCERAGYILLVADKNVEGDSGKKELTQLTPY